MDSVQLTDGTTTVDLNDGSSYQLVNWSPSYEGTEVIRFQVLGTGTQVASRVRAVEEVLEQVRRWVMAGVGHRWWLQWQPNGLSTEVEAELLYDGDDPNWLRPTDRQSRYWEVKVRREPFWRGARAVVPVSNKYGTDNTTGLQVDNTDDTNLDNWVEIDGVNDIEGDMPALTEIQMVNNDPATNFLEAVRMGLRVKYESGSWRKFTFENDEATSILGSQSSGSTYSGGNYHSGTFGGGISEVATWTITPAFIRELAGYWRVVGRGDFPETVWVTAWDYDEAYVLTPLMDGSGPLLDFGIVKLPPWPAPQDIKSATLYLTIYHQYTGAWWLDYLSLVPAQEGYRRVYFTGTQWDDGVKAVDDGILDEVGIMTATTRSLIGRGVGKRIELVPGYDQRIYFHQEGSVLECNINRQLSVTVYATPRYRFFAD